MVKDTDCQALPREFLTQQGWQGTERVHFLGTSPSDADVAGPRDTRGEPLHKGYPTPITVEKSLVLHMLAVDSGLSMSHVWKFGMNSSCNAVAIKNMNCECIRRPRKQAVREKGTW